MSLKKKVLNMVHMRVSSLVVTIMLLTSMIVATIPSIGLAQDPFDPVWQFAGQQLTNMSNTISTTSYPSSTTSSGSWNTTSASSWTSGFFPGSLWLMYQRTADPAWRTKAQQWQAGIESQKNNTSTHDIGFMIFNSFGNGYRLTGDTAYRQVVLTAAASLATRYSPVVGCIRSWNTDSSTFRVIIDNIMNLELLFWASKQSGGKPEWYEMAVSHALKTMANHVRADGSTYQIVDYDPATGKVKAKATRQGYDTESTWSRGQAWAVYGFTMAYRYTGDPRFLDTARKTADYFINHLPSDKVPYWDFEAPGIPNEPRDSSAAAIAASGLLELSQRESDATRKQTYRTNAQAILDALRSPAYLAQGTTNKAILLHGTQNKPDGKYDTGLIYGDYYFLEALLRSAATSPGGTPTPSLTPTSMPTSTSVPVANLLKNASFEVDANADSRPDSWTSNSKFTRSTATTPHHGTYAGRFRATDNSGVTISQTVSSLSAGKTYTFSGWVKRSATSDSFTFKLQVRWRNASNSTIRTDTIKSYTDDTNGAWNQATKSLAAPTGTTNAQVQMVVSSLNGTIYVDDFVFKLQ